jgi:peptidoglycan hydrolase-like protein with peptidoglycan-binding domain
MNRVLICLCAFSLALPTLLRADEQVRQAQEELRKRNLYFGNVDGKNTAEFGAALKRYQKRKGFTVSGNIDQVTATSLHISTTTVVVGSFPDTPVLKSDTASALPESERLALLREAEEKPDPAPTPAPPAESPAPGQDIDPERINKFVADYLRDGESEDVATQLKYYAFPVRYFDHGSVSEQFVTKDTRNYIKRWPERKYTLTGPIAFFASASNAETNIEFTIAFELRSNARTTKNKVSGRTKNWWTVRPEGEDLKIVAIREERIRE